MSAQAGDTHVLRGSVLIARSPAVVFEYLRDIETRLRLNPSYRLTGFEWLTPGPPSPGSRYRVRAMVADVPMDYMCEVSELVEGERLATRGVGSGITVRLTLTPAPEGCRLTHEEQFRIPAEALQPEPGSGRALMTSLLVALFGQREAPLLDTERERRIQATVTGLEQRLQHWLELLRRDIERSSS